MRENVSCLLKGEDEWDLNVSCNTRNVALECMYDPFFSDTEPLLTWAQDEHGRHHMDRWTAKRFLKAWRRKAIIYTRWLSLSSIGPVCSWPG
jgi:hypothetical protein